MEPVDQLYLESMTESQKNDKVTMKYLNGFPERYKSIAPTISKLQIKKKLTT